MINVPLLKAKIEPTLTIFFLCQHYLWNSPWSQNITTTRVEALYQSFVRTPPAWGWTCLSRTSLSPPAGRGAAGPWSCPCTAQTVTDFDFKYHHAVLGVFYANTFCAIAIFVTDSFSVSARRKQGSLGPVSGTTNCCGEKNCGSPRKFSTLRSSSSGFTRKLSPFRTKGAFSYLKCNVKFLAVTKWREHEDVLFANCRHVGKSCC